MTGIRICKRTDMQCATPDMCNPHGGCLPVGANDYRLSTVAVGWKCPVCGKGNAPFMPTCGNQLCGVDLSKATA